ncbi:MAG: hypothetical protein EZS28_051253, partial [Streblomastix strix]
MSNTGELFEVTSDFAGRENDYIFLPVKQGDIVRMIKKDLVYSTVEKDGQIGKVPQGKLKRCISTP